MAIKNLHGYENKPEITEPLQTAEDTVAWTPSEKLVKAVINDFLDRVEPNWLEATIRRDPALYKHMDLEENDLKAFLGSRETAPTLNLADLTKQKKISQKTLDEITNEVKTYQGLHAIAFHKIAHALYNRGMEEKQSDNRTEAAKDLLLARQISQGVRRLTAGIEIHPGADIGKNFFIDHGASVVIGETCEIADNVFIYHGVTLGAAAGKEVAAAPGKLIARRHPKIGEGTIISTGVNILGPITIGSGVSIAADALIQGNVTIGDGVKIQSAVVVTRDIKAGANVVGSLPNIPGIFNHDKHPEKSLAGMPIIQPNSSTEIEADLSRSPLNHITGAKVLFNAIADHVRHLASITAR